MIKLNIHGVTVEVETAEEAQKLLSTVAPQQRPAKPTRLSSSRLQYPVEIDYDICQDLMSMIGSLKRNLFNDERAILEEKYTTILQKINPKYKRTGVNMRIYYWHRLLEGAERGKGLGCVNIHRTNYRLVMDKLQRYHPHQLAGIREYLT